MSNRNKGFFVYDIINETASIYSVRKVYSFSGGSNVKI